jgi:hypothetical protein
MKYILTILAVFTLSSCCDFYFEETCEFQTTEKTVTVPLTFSYEVNTTGSFVEAHRVTAADVLKALKEPVEDGEIKRIEIVGATINYARQVDNTAATLNVAAAVVDNTIDLLLMNEIQSLPLYDVPFLLNINEYLNGKGIEELKKILKNYVIALNQDGFSVLLTGKGFPEGSLAHFVLDINMTVTVVYEVCEWLPLGLGDEICN